MISVFDKKIGTLCCYVDGDDITFGEISDPYAGSSDLITISWFEWGKGFKLTYEIQEFSKLVDVNQIEDGYYIITEKQRMILQLKY